jgi:signal peptidase II
MVRKFLTLTPCLTFAIFSALALRSELQLSDLNGMQIFSLIWISLELHYTVNTGINFGLAGNADETRQFTLASLALAISIGILIWSWRDGRIFVIIAGSLFAGGGLANAYERVIFGGVFDYLNVSATFYNNPYSFNLADVYIFSGLILIVFAPSTKDKVVNDTLDV